MKRPITLAIDIGTSSVRGALYDAGGMLFRPTVVKIERAVTRSSAGAAEVDANESFDQVVETIDAVLAKAVYINARIEHVVSCSFWHSLVGVDARDRPTTKVFTWADTQSKEYTAELKRRFDENEVHDRTGVHFHSSFWPAKLLWLRKERPDVWAKTARWLSLSDYLTQKFFGMPATSRSMASGTGIFDLRRSLWDKELLKFLKITGDQLPVFPVSDDLTFRLPPAYAERWPRLADAEWFPTIADGAADNIGSGCMTRDSAALMIGTSGAMRVLYEGDPPSEIPQGLWCYRVSRRRVVLGGALSDGGNLYDWIKRNLRISPSAEREIRKRAAAAHGLLFMPFLHGERSTGYNENATGQLRGLTANHDSIDILQAGMESVAYRFADVFDRLNTIAPIREIVASGGALQRSAVWTQILADVLGRDLTLSTVSEASSRGAVLLALDSARRIDSIESLPVPATSTLAHDPQCHAAYKEARARHQALYQTTF